MTEVFVCCLNQNCFSFHKYATENCPNKPICINKILQQIVGDEIVTRVYCSNSQSVFLTKTGKLHFYNFIQDQEKTKKNKVSRNIKKKRKLNKKHRSHSQLKQNSDCPNFLSSTPSFLPYLYSFQNDEQEIPNLRKEFYIENRTEKKKKTKKKINQENQNVVSALNLSNTEIKKEIKKKVVTISKFKGKRVEKIVFSKKGAVVLVEGDVYQLFYNTVPDNKAKINRIAFNPKRQIIDLVAGDYWYVAIDRYQKPYFWGECHQMDLCGKKKKKDKIAQDTKREKQKKNKNKKRKNQLDLNEGIKLTTEFSSTLFSNKSRTNLEIAPNNGFAHIVFDDSRSIKNVLKGNRVDFTISTKSKKNNSKTSSTQNKNKNKKTKPSFSPLFLQILLFRELIKNHDSSEKTTRVQSVLRERWS
eukprot:Anaeramoba_flamelloidesa809734_30.p1 GENE.a809734_30~~a809734_30.p1  ORF type:complete len:415 (-),score=98.28 a809734_30:145-1389(-)